MVSAVAIVVTLGYLAFQTQQNTRALQMSAQQGLLEREMDSLNAMMANPDINLLFDKPELTDLERAKLYAFLTSFMRARESIYRQYTLGVIDEETYERIEYVKLYLLQSPRVHNYWVNSELAYTPRFVERINSRIATVEGAMPVGAVFLEQVFSPPGSSE